MSKTIYVDAAAKTEGDGTSANPFRSITSSLNVAAPGDSVRIRSGMYKISSVSIETEGLRVSCWGPGRVRIVAGEDDTFAVNITADQIEIGGLEVRANKGIYVAGDYCTVRDVGLFGCVQPLVVSGHYNVITNNTVKSSRIKDDGRLVEVVGDYNFVSQNVLANNAASRCTGIFVQGYGAKVLNNIIDCRLRRQLLYGIVSSSLTAASTPEPCPEQEISYNRVYGLRKGGSIRIEGPTHEKTRIQHNTLVSASQENDEDIQLVDAGEDITLAANLVCSSKDKKDQKFHSLDVNDPGYLVPVPAGGTKVDINEHAAEYVGARPTHASAAPQNIAFGKTLGVTGEMRLEDGGAGNADVVAVDGYRYNGTDFLWKKPGRLGWHSLEPFYVILDLGNVEPIAAVRINMGNKVDRSAFLPYEIKIAVSDDDHDYYPAGEIRRPSEVPDGNYLLEASDLATRGRYVLLEIHPNGEWPCLDEIEVIRGYDAPDNSHYGRGSFTRPDAFPLGLERLSGNTQNTNLRKATDVYIRYKNDLKRMLEYSELIEGRKGPSERLSLARQQVKLLEEQLRPGNNREKPTIRAGIQQICATLAEFLFEGRGNYVLSQSNPYDRLETTEIPVYNTADIEAVTISLCRDETEPCAFLITNCTAEPLHVRIGLDVPVNLDGEAFPLDQIELRRPLEMFFWDRYINDALVKLDQTGRTGIEIPAGQTQQIWISVNASNVKSGTYKSRVTVSAEQARATTFSLIVHVHELEIPAHSTLRNFPWFYCGLPRFNRDRSFSIGDLRRHRVNTVNEHSFTPWPPEGAFDANGHLVKPIDYSALDNMLIMFDKNVFDFYLFKILFENEARRKLAQPDLDFGSERWKTALREWINDWARHMEENYGITTEQFALYVYDEPVIDQLEQYIARVGQTLKTAAPETYPYAHRVKVFINPMPDFLLSSAFSHLQAADRYLDIICPVIYDYPQKTLDDLHALDSETWGYTVMSRLSDPYADSRLMGWKAMRQELKGIGFWVWGYTDTNRDIIYGFDEKVLGAGEEPFVPSRRWEAWRDGIEDYELLAKLKALAEDGAKKGLSPDEIKHARAVFDLALENVLTYKDDPSIAIAERQNLIDTIVKLSIQP